MPLFFNAEALPAPKTEYVCWLDVMGTQTAMSQSLRRSANFIAKLHVAALSAPRDEARLYPAMDGMYVTTQSQQELQTFLRYVFGVTGETFSQEANPLHRFFIKAAIAFGPVIHGCEIPPAANNIFEQNPLHRDSLLLGAAMIQAYRAEKQAPPFGVFVHESARSFAPDGSRPMAYTWWRWFQNANDPAIQSLANALREHYKWCVSSAGFLEYPIEKIREHRAKAFEYFHIEPD